MNDNAMMRSADQQSRYLLSVSQYLKALDLSPDVLAGVTAWLEAQTKWMATSEQGAQARAYGNNISVWYHALVRPAVAARAHD